MNLSTLTNLFSVCLLLRVQILVCILVFRVSTYVLLNTGNLELDNT